MTKPTGSEPERPADSSRMPGTEEVSLPAEGSTPRSSAVPAGLRDDELMADPPDHEAGFGGLSGYRHGSRMRKILAWAVVASVVGAFGVGRWWYQRKLAAARGEVVVQYQVEDGGERSRELVWSGGRARLGLSRRPPGVEAIRLPDRLIRLASGHDHAQVVVEVREGRTRELSVLSGAIEEVLRVPPGSGPAPGAREP